MLPRERDLGPADGAYQQRRHGECTAGPQPELRISQPSSAQHGRGHQQQNAEKQAVVAARSVRARVRGGPMHGSPRRRPAHETRKRDERPDDAPQCEQLKHIDLPVHERQQTDHRSAGPRSGPGQPQTLQQTAREPPVERQELNDQHVVRQHRVGDDFPERPGQPARDRLGLGTCQNAARGEVDGRVPVVAVAVIDAIDVPVDRPHVQERNGRRGCRAHGQVRTGERCQRHRGGGGQGDHHDIRGQPAPKMAFCLHIRTRQLHAPNPRTHFASRGMSIN